ncbi:hypothetical protein ANANG_G00094240, partial [Anguilla anguilla]
YTRGRRRLCGIERWKSSTAISLHITPHHSTSLHITPHHAVSLHITPHHSTSLHITPHHSVSSVSLRITPHHSTSLHITPRCSVLPRIVGSGSLPLLGVFWACAASAGRGGRHRPSWWGVIGRDPG